MSSNTRHGGGNSSSGGGGGRSGGGGRGHGGGRRDKDDNRRGDGRGGRPSPRGGSNRDRGPSRRGDRGEDQTSGTTAENTTASALRGTGAREREDVQGWDAQTQPESTRGPKEQQGRSDKPKVQLPPTPKKNVGQPLGLVEGMPIEGPISLSDLQQLEDVIEERIAELEPHVESMCDPEYPSTVRKRMLAIGKGQGSLDAQTTYLNAMCRLLDHDADLLAAIPDDRQYDQRKTASWLRIAISGRKAQLNITEKRRWLTLLEFKWAQARASKPLEMAYPGCFLKIWEASKEEEQDAKKGYDQKIPVLLLGEKVWNVRIGSLVKRDLDWCYEFHRGKKDQEGACKYDMMVSTFLMNTEVAEFMDSNLTNSEGLLVLGADLRTPKLPGSSLSGIMWEIVDLLRERANNIVLVHATGLRDTLSPDIRSEKCDHLRGLVGCLRSICVQLMHWSIDAGLQVDWRKIYTTVDANESEEDSIRGLCLLFRAVLVAVAAVGAKNQQRHVVTVLIDDLHILEADDNFRTMVFFFRTICDEAFFGALGEAITFRYVLLHPRISHLLETPHFVERVVLFPRSTFDVGDNIPLAAKKQRDVSLRPPVIVSSTQYRSGLDELQPVAVSSTQYRSGVDEVAVSSTRHRSSVDDELETVDMEPSQGGPESGDKGKRAVYLDNPATDKSSLLVGKAIGSVTGVTMGYALSPWQLKEAVSNVKSQIAELCKHVDTSSVPEFERRQAEFVSVQEDYTKRVQKLKPELLALLEAEFGSFSDDRKDRTRATYTKILDNLDKMPNRSDFVMLRRWMMRIEFINLSSKESTQVQMEYPEHFFKIGSICAPVDPTIAEKERPVWKKALRNYLWRDLTKQTASAAHSPGIVADMDHKDSVKILEDLKDDVKRQTLEKQVDRYVSTSGGLLPFRYSRESQGLLILGCDLRRGTGVQSWSHTSYLLSCYTRRPKAWEAKGHSAIFLRHYTGYRHRSNDDTKRKMLSGVRGLMRSLCEQMINNSSRQLKLSLEFVDSMTKDDVTWLQEGDHRLLCGLFRELVIDSVNDSKICDHTRNIIVAIDEIEFLERSEEKEEFFYVVDFFRALVDEMNLADWGKYVIFKYVLVHPGFSKLLGRPHPREHVKICTFEDTAVRAQEIQAEQAEEAEAEEAEAKKAKVEKAKAEKSAAKEGK